MATSRPVSPTVAALQFLRPSGDKSLEALVSALLSKLSGIRLRRCKAGTQLGVDALAEIPFGVEVKRHEESPRARDLLGGLSEATLAHPDLQLWIVVSTAEIGAIEREKILKKGEAEGIGVLIVDPGAMSDALPDVSPIAALAASDITAVISALEDPTWLGPKRLGAGPDVQSVRGELENIRGRAEFVSWEQRFRSELEDLPLWGLLVKRQNARLKAQIQSDALLNFGTDFEPTAVVPRTAEQQISSWWEQANEAAGCRIAVVTGDRYDGKTWTVFSWLCSHLDDLPVPVFLISSTRGIRAAGDIEALILDDLRASLGTYERQAKNLLARQRERSGLYGVWAILILDGMNEYVSAKDALSRQILWAVPAATKALRSGDASSEPKVGAISDPQPEAKPACAILATTRALSDDDAKERFGPRTVRRIPVGSYDDAELAQALARHDLASDVVQRLPASARLQARRPRYLELVFQHQDVLGHFTSVTVDVLYYLDASDKLGVRAGAGKGSWDPDRHKDFLASLAGDWLSGRRLTPHTVYGHLKILTAEVDSVFEDLRSGGLLHQGPDGTFMPPPDRLAFAMGLFIRSELLSQNGARNLGEVLRDLLAPRGDDDEKVRWLRSAAVISALSNNKDDRSIAATDTLISAWLTARNLNNEDLAEIHALAPFLLDPLLRVAAPPSGAEPVNGRLELIIERVVAANLPGRRETVMVAAKLWLRAAPVGRRWFIGGTPASAEETSRILSDQSLVDLGLTLGSERVIRLQRLALHLNQATPGLLEPQDILALLASRRAVSGYLTGGERLATRLVLFDVGVEWFEREVALWESRPSSLRTQLLAELLAYADRSDLSDLQRRLPDLGHRKWPGGRLSAEEFAAVLLQEQTGEDVLDTARRAEDLAINPDTPIPPSAWRALLSERAISTLGGPRLQAYRSRTREDHDLETVEPALAAWAPDVGAAILTALLEDIPARIAKGKRSWSYDLPGHAALLTPLIRDRLQEALRGAEQSDPDLRYPLQLLLLCLLPGLAPESRLETFLNHTCRDEWAGLYDLLAQSGDEVWRGLVLHAVRTENDPLRLLRARYLLGYLLGFLGNVELNREDLERLSEDVERSSGEERNAALDLLGRCRVPGDADESILRPLVAPARAPETEAWQYAAWLHRRSHPDERRGVWVARSLSAPLTASERLPRADSNEEQLVEQALAAFLSSVQSQLSGASPTDRWRDTEFPDLLVNHLADVQFDAWVEALLADSTRTEWMWPGVLVSVTRRALRSGHKRLPELWRLCYPFQRGRSSGFVRFTVNDLHWALTALQEPEVADPTAESMLRELVLDCRTDQELLEIALASRGSSSERLIRVLETLRADREPSVRARAVFTLGWLPPSNVPDGWLSSVDASGWVEGLGKEATRRLDRERFAEHWLRRFLATESEIDQWAAGRLFLSCADVTTRFWAFEEVLSSQAISSRKGEALLLLRQVRDRSDDSTLRGQFLGYEVRELEEVVAPWRQYNSWEPTEASDQEEK